MTALQERACKVWEQGYTQNRELSWLQFNSRVLEEAEDESVPLLERMKFLSIFTSNLDEFFMIRVGSLCDLASLHSPSIDNKSGLTPSLQLEKIFKAASPLYKRRERVFINIQKKLSEEGVFHLAIKDLEPHEQKYIKQYFKTMVMPILSPQIVDAHHPFPHLMGKVLHIGVRLMHKSNELFGLLPVPAALPSVVFMPDSKTRYVLIEEILLEYADTVFEMYEVVEKAIFCVTRNADINPEDEAFDVESDFRKKMEHLLKQRRRLAVVRVEISSKISEHFSSYFRARFDVDESQIYICHTPLKLDYVFSLGECFNEQRRSELSQKPFSPQPPENIDPQQGLIKQVLKKGDIVFSYPYESMEPFLQLIREAANDVDVLSIRITIYRLASKAKLVEYLCAAAENGKDVTVLIELRARFDEQNNIDWSERLEDAGCKIIYGFEGYKVHSKLCLITRREKGMLRYITQVGTGNYNENTAKLYTDISLLTADEDIGADATTFFNNMALGNLDGRYERLLVAPFGLKPALLSLIDEQIAKGKSGYILLKFNSLTDIDIIERLKQASCAGVTVEMIIRGICCLLPQVEGKTDNITVRSIVGRFLEHSRIFCFGRGNEAKMYISSADLMTRNTERRVEIACPIYSSQVKARLFDILFAMQADNVKARTLCSDGSYIKAGAASNAVNAQVRLMEKAIENAQLKAAEQKPSKLHWWRRIGKKSKG